MIHRLALLACAAACVAAGACSGAPSHVAGGDGGGPDGTPTRDGQPPIDATSAELDASASDAFPRDASTADAMAADAVPADAAPTLDAQPANHNPHGIGFVDVTGAMAASYLGGRTDANGWGLGSGVAVGDVDGDGDLDLVLARCDALSPERPGGPSLVLEQLPASAGVPSFASDAAFAGAFAGSCAHGAALADYDGDGDLDLFMAMAGGDRLLANDGTGRFTDVTSSAGVAGPLDGISSGAVWADVNADGLLDLYVTTHTPLLPPAPTSANANRLYLNRADGRFVEVSAASGAAGNGSSQTAAIANLDDDPDLEIYVSNDTFAVDGQGGIGTLDPDAWLDPTGFDDEGVPVYSDRSAAYGMDDRRSSMGVALTDLDGDGRTEIYVSDWGPNHLQQWNAVASAYDSVAAAWNLALPRTEGNYRRVSWGARFVDLDRDGAAELLLVNGSVTEPINCHSLAQLDQVMRRSPGATRFEDITVAAGLPGAQPCAEADLTRPYSGRGAVFADLDGDGDDDLIVAPFVEAYRFYRNDTPATHHFVRVLLRGTVSAPDPVGARLVVTDGSGATRALALHAGGTPHGHSHRMLEIGLGTTDAVASAYVEWPSGYRQRVDAMASFAVDRTVHVSEPAWLTLTARTAAGTDPAPVLEYVAVDEAGAAMGAAGAGRDVQVTRSDGLTVAVVDRGDGTYTANLPHPGSPRVTVVAITVDAEPVNTRPTVNYR